MKTVRVVPARLPYLRHLPNYTEHGCFISTTRNVARYRKHPRSTCRWHRRFRNACKDVNEPARSKSLFIVLFLNSRCLTWECGWERTRKKMLTAVTYLYTRRRRNTTVSMAIVVSQEIRRTRRQPAETNFSHPDCGESLRPPARLFFREFYTSHPEVWMSKSRTLSLAPRLR